jgi:hypothetical protein
MDLPRLRTLLQNLLPEKMQVKDFKIINSFDSSGEPFVSLNAQMMAGYSSHPELISIAIQDIIEQRVCGRRMAEHAGQVLLPFDRQGLAASNFQAVSKSADLAQRLLKHQRFRVSI